MLNLDNETSKTTRRKRYHFLGHTCTVSWWNRHRHCIRELSVSRRASRRSRAPVRSSLQPRSLPGMFHSTNTTRVGGVVIFQATNPPTLLSFQWPQKFYKLSWNFCRRHWHRTIIRDFPQFRQISVKLSKKHNRFSSVMPAKIYNTSIRNFTDFVFKSACEKLQRCRSWNPKSTEVWKNARKILTRRRYRSLKPNQKTWKYVKTYFRSESIL